MQLQLAGGRRAVIVCTSGSRPSSPALGQPIYETDTGHVLFWDGNSWDQAPREMLTLIGSGPDNPAPAGAAPYVQAGQVINLPFTAGGVATFNFPVPFPNGVTGASVVGGPGNINVGLAALTTASMTLYSWDIVLNAAYENPVNIYYVAFGY